MSNEGSESLPSRFGRYTLLERLAVGGMAEAFRAKITSSHGFEKSLVIKRILPHLAADPSFVSMFVDEAKLTAQLSHQKIVQILDFGDVAGQYFIALELIDGFDALALLRTCVHKRKSIPSHLAVFIVSEVLDALDYAHSARDDFDDKPLRIVHRDISPSNIFISKRGEVKLGDFGIAHAQRRDSKTNAGTFKGKYGYMSPEQVSSQALDARSDLFAMGVVLVEMLLGRRLFVAANDLDVLLMVRDARIDRLDKYGSHLHPTLNRIVRRALKKEPRERYGRASQFRDDLADYLYEIGRRVGPADLREFVGDLFAASPESAARQVAEARVEKPKGAAPAPPPATEPPPQRSKRPRRPTMVELGADATTAPANYEILNMIHDFWSSDGSDPDQASARGFTPVPTVGEAQAPALHALLQPAPTLRRRSDIGRFVSCAPDRPPDSAGDISIITPMRLLCDLAVAGETGLLRFEAGEVIKEIWLRSGAPESVSSNVPSERLGEYLVAKDVISSGDLDLALAMLPQYGGKLGDTLVGLGFLRPLDVFRLLSLQVRDRVIDILDWTAGTFAFYRGVTNPGEGFPLGLNTFQILGAAVTNLPSDFLDRRFASSLDCRPVKSNHLRIEPEAFRIGPTPGEVREMLDGARPLRAWMDAFADQTERLTFVRSLYLLVETDLAQLE